VLLRSLAIPDDVELTPEQYPDDRGVFLEQFRSDRLAEYLGYAPTVAQVNVSVSARGVVRGIHYADIPPGQSKYVTVAAGRILDYVIDLRVGSPTFGEWEAVPLDDELRRAVFLAEGLGHAFVALSEQATVSYLVSDIFRPEREHGISPLDPEIDLSFPEDAGELVLSPKDRAAPTLTHALAAGSLPTWEQAQERYAALREGTR
jgi:dTDP-4-dehydrorhamnose 3,5-epimerase